MQEISSYTSLYSTANPSETVLKRSFSIQTFMGGMICFICPLTFHQGQCGIIILKITKYLRKTVSHEVPKKMFKLRIRSEYYKAMVL